jgi:hypothetical protein
LVSLTLGPWADAVNPNRRHTRQTGAIAEAARRLNELHEAWLNPADLVERVLEVAPGFPDRIIPVSPKAALILKKRP